jgi:hypothetical protein
VYNIRASSEQEAIDEGVYRFVREFPNYSITGYTTVRLYKKYERGRTAFNKRYTTFG